MAAVPRATTRVRGSLGADGGIFTKVAHVYTNAGAPTNGTTGAGVAGIGSLYTDTTNGKLYINTGTLASPTWTIVGTQT